MRVACWVGRDGRWSGLADGVVGRHFGWGPLPKERRGTQYPLADLGCAGGRDHNPFVVILFGTTDQQLLRFKCVAEIVSVASQGGHE